MKNKGIKLIKEGVSDIQDLSNKIKSNINADLVYDNWRYTNDVKIIFMCFEKYYFRNNSAAGLSLLISVPALPVRLRSRGTS